MAEKIYISAVTGLTISLQIYSGSSPVGAPFASSEIGSTGEYVADFPLGVPYGSYLLVATVGAGVKIASGIINWTGQYEMLDALSKLEGLDAANPLTITPDSRTVGDIQQDITGDGISETIVTNVS